MRQDGKPTPVRCPIEFTRIEDKLWGKWATESEQLDESRDILKREREVEGLVVQKQRYEANKVAAGWFKRSEGNGR